MRVRDETVGGFLDALAAAGPAPGAGSAAAVALALGIGCLRKAIAITLKHHPERDPLVAADAHLAGLVDQALAGGDADIARFTAEIRARQADDAPAAAQAREDLVAIDANLVAVADEAVALVARHEAAIVTSMAADVAAARALIRAARAIHAACAAEAG